MPSGHRREYGTVDRWLNAVVYYGLGQQLLLALPFMWLVFQQPTPHPMAELTLVAMSAAALTVGLFRVGAVPDGRPWPALSGAKLGTGEPGGYRAFARRLVTLSAILSLAVVGGALVRAATGSVALALPAVVALSVCGVASVPTLEADTLRAGLARVGFHLAGLAALAWFARPFDPTVGVTSAPLAYALVVGCTVADSWPVGRRLRERLRRSDRTG